MFTSYFYTTIKYLHLLPHYNHQFINYMDFTITGIASLFYTILFKLSAFCLGIG